LLDPFLYFLLLDSIEIPARNLLASLTVAMLGVSCIVIQTFHAFETNVGVLLVSLLNALQGTQRMLFVHCGCPRVLVEVLVAGLVLVLRWLGFASMRGFVAFAGLRLEGCVHCLAELGILQELYRLPGNNWCSIAVGPLSGAWCTIQLSEVFSLSFFFPL
jgi:hypothetical protein